MPCKRSVLPIAFLLSTPLVAQQASTSYQWLIEKAEGTWEVQEAGQAPRPLSGKYEILTQTSSVRCIASVAPASVPPAPPP